MSKRLGNVKRVATFAPALTNKFTHILTRKSKKTFEKKLKKDLDCK